MEDDVAQTVSTPEPLIGLTEAVAWLATRDEGLARRVAASTGAAAGTARRAAASRVAEWLVLIEECRARVAQHPDIAFSELRAAAMMEEIASKGRSGGGFVTIPADQWIDAEMDYGAEPDALRPAGFPARIFGTVWTHVRFIRADVYWRWPPPDSAPIAVEVADKAAWEAECKRVAEKLDESRVSIRDVRASHIKQHWNRSLGVVAKVGAIVQLMSGKPKGRPSGR